MTVLKKEDIIANAIIEKSVIKGSTNVTLNEVIKYAIYLNKYFEENNIDAKADINSTTAIELDEKFSNYFISYVENDDYGYKINEEKTVENLQIRFRNEYSEEIIKALINSEIVAKIF